MTRCVGVLGGMGPAATWDFCAKLQDAFGATRDQDAPRVLVDCDPSVPDRNAAALGEGPSPAARLEGMARGLERSGADLLCMPCNAAHAYGDRIREAVAVPFVGMPDATVAAVRARAPGAVRVGLLATTGTMRAGVYARALQGAGLTAVPVPEARERSLMDLVYAVKAGAPPAPLRTRAAALAQAFVDDGAEVLVAACTEIPLILDQGATSVPLVESTAALAAAVAAAATADARSAA